MRLLRRGGGRKEKRQRPGKPHADISNAHFPVPRENHSGCAIRPPACVDILILKMAFLLGVCEPAKRVNRPPGRVFSFPCRRSRHCAARRAGELPSRLRRLWASATSGASQGALAGGAEQENN